MSSECTKTVILFTRIPHAGTTKTRLMPFLSADECVNLHYSMMGDEIAEICRVADKLEVAYFEDTSVTDDDRDDFRSFLMQEASIPFITMPQRGSDIFMRMQRVFADSFENDCTSIKLLVGCDLPELKATDLDVAFDGLSTCDVVLNPSDDGGYWLVGMKKYEPCIFEVSGDGASTVLADTCKCCTDNSLTFKLGHKVRDLDVKEDLCELYNNQECLDVGSLTRAFLNNFDASRFSLANDHGLSVSVIVPVYNEESTIEAFVSSLNGIFDEAEVIFVDGGSTDATVSILKQVLPSNDCLIDTGKGRAHQMNEGARASKGDALMFLHADCIPPKNMVSEVKRVLAYANWGCFGVKFDDRDPLMKICQIISNNRIHDRKVVFGDQGIFIKRELFEEIGGFPEIPIMEDYQLSLTLKDKGEKIGVAKGLITTSSRRYHEGGKLKVMWKMNRLRKAYRDGVPIETISEQYRDIR